LSPRQTANTTQKDEEPSGGAENICGSTPGREPPKIKDSKDKAIAAMIKYWALIAKL
jgi:hypothetical protein